MKTGEIPGLSKNKTHDSSQALFTSHLGLAGAQFCNVFSSKCTYLQKQNKVSLSVTKNAQLLGTSRLSPEIAVLGCYRYKTRQPA